MISEFSAYDPNTGQIKWHLSCPTSMVDVNLPSNLSTVEGLWEPNDFFVFDGEIRSRPDIEMVVSGHTVSNLPVPCTVRIDGQDYEIEDGAIEFESNHPGPHSLRIEAFPYKPTVIVLP